MVQLGRWSIEALGLTPKYALERIKRSSWGSKGTSGGWILDDGGILTSFFARF